MLRRAVPGYAEGTILPEWETWYGHALVFSSPVRVRGSYTFDSGTVTMEGIIEAETEDRCSRCGKPVQVRLRIPFTERFVKDAPVEDGDAYVYSGDVICPDRMILEDRSTSTRENLLFSNEKTGCAKARCGILSNNFHVF